MTANALEYGVAPPGYRLPAATRVGCVRLQVSDLSRSLEFYQRVLGLREIDRDGAAATLGAEDDARTLVELRERRGVQPVPRRGRLGLFHFALLLPDRASLGRFLLHLGELGAQPGMSDHLVSEALYLQDPDNLGIEVYADRPRSEWRARDAQLAMATEPLDVQSLVAAAGGTRWAGAPRGTTMGHVHLHVGELDHAEAFYHAALGLDKIVWSYPGALFLSAGGYHHHLGVNTWARGAPSATDADARLLEWVLVLPSSADVAAARGSLESAGFVAETDGDAIRVRDPWGTSVRLTPR